jgi:Fe2+ or Zn2+ uptake regulation protein
LWHESGEIDDLPKNWDPIPIHTYIVELLEKKKGASTDDELYKMLKEKFDDLELRTFNKTLMKLEVGGIIRVSSLAKKTRNVELMSKT